MRRRTILIVIVTALALAASAAPARAQGKLEIGGYAMVGAINFAAHDSFDAVLGITTGTFFGGGGKVGLPWGGLFVDIGAWRFEKDGERVLRAGGQVYKLGIPVTVQVTPLEVTGGWQFRTLSRRFVPYVGAGFSSYAYKETSSFAGAGEDVDDRFSGYHISGGVGVKVLGWLGVAGEAAWTTIPDALGEGGVSKEFGETDLGGTSYRLKIIVGR